MKLLIVVQHPFELWNVPQWFPERLREEFSNLEVTHLRNYDGIEREIADAEVLMTWSLKEEQLAFAKKLRWIHSPAAAVHGLMTPALRASDIVVTNASSVHGETVAEHAIAMVLALARRLNRAFAYQQRHVWSQQPLWEERPRPKEIRGATLGVIGLGAIGREVARLSKALGMRLLAVREHPERGAETADEVYAFEQIDSVLRRSDFVVLAAPLTPKTKRFFDASKFEAMNADAYFVNVSRGALVDEQAMISALQNDEIAGAGLDVFEREPLPQDSPLWNMPNVMITPHMAGVTEHLWERHYELLAENLRRYRAGEKLLGVVDKRVGY